MSINNEFVERYQKLWDSDQTSRVFAPLAEAYRKTGNIQRALQICRQGLNLHPSFAGGWFQLAKIYLDRKETEKSIDALKKAVSLAPENIQAHNLLAELYLNQRLPKEALKSFKMVLLLNPEDSRAKRTIEKLESLTADEYSNETFQIGNLDNISSLNAEDAQNYEVENEIDSNEREIAVTSKNKKIQVQDKALTQTITLVDAFLIRNEFSKAKSILQRAILRFGDIESLSVRLHSIEKQKEKSLKNNVDSDIHISDK